MNERFVYIGTYTIGSSSQGIYVFRLKLETGELNFVHEIQDVSNPSFLTLSPDQKYLYAVNELVQFQDTSGGGATAFSIDPESGFLEKINQVPTYGIDPCHISLDHTGRLSFVANYTSGSMTTFAIHENGALSQAIDVYQYTGTGPNTIRQEAAHAHCVTVDPANQFAFTVDLGTDKIMIYRVDLLKGKLVPSQPSFYAVTPGSGPRHFVFHPNRKLAYLINELHSTICVFNYSSQKGILTEKQTISTLPKGFAEENTCADIHIHPSRKFIYGSNRGHDSIAAFQVHPTTGTLAFIHTISTLGKTPRNFAIDPQGNYLFVANQESDSIVTFKINQQTGELTATGQIDKVPSPVCIKIR